MFTDFSMCPGGAMMMHEDASEYDPNVATPIASTTYENVLRTDPVSSVINATRGLYESIMELISTVSLEPDDKREYIENLDKASKLATNVAETMRMILVKYDAYVKVTSTENWMFEAFRDHMGQFIRHSKWLTQNGYDSYSFNYSELKSFQSYMSSRAILVMMTNMKGLPRLPVSLDDLRAVEGTDDLFSNFSTLQDMFDCLYKDPERMLRIEEHTNVTMTVRQLMDRCSYSIADRVIDKPRYIMSDSDNLPAYVVDYISHELRIIKQKIYQMQCDELEPKAEADIISPDKRKAIHEDMSKVMAAIYNIFTFSLITCISFGYIINRNVLMHEECADYVERTLKKMP